MHLQSQNARKKFDAVVFDLYGTLIYVRDTTQISTPLMKELGFETIDEIRTAKAIGLTECFDSMYDFARRIKPGYLADVNLAGVKKYEALLFKKLNSVEPFPETIDVLTQLRADNYTIGVISNVSSPYLIPFFYHGLDKLIDCSIFSCEVGIKKPNSRIYKLVLESLGLRADRVIMVGNNLNSDVLAPRNTGMSSILLNRNRDSDFPDRIASLEEIFAHLYY